MIIRGMGNIGTSGNASSPPVTTPSATAPSQVGSLAAGSPGNVSIPVTYTAASGTATISYAGRVALHGSSSFSANSGTFSATGGQFVGLSAGTAYDFQIVATNAAGSSTTTLSNISTTSASVYIPPTPYSGAANRFDLVLDRSVAALGDTVNGSLIFNGSLPTSSGRTVTLSNGTVVNLPTSGSQTVPFSFVLTAPMAPTSEVSLTPTNNAGLYNPYPAPLTVFSPGAGSAQVIATSLTRLDQVTFQRDTASGDPTGYSLASKGWGEVWFNLGQSGPALFARLYDAKSNGASSAVGSGTALTGVVQVHGSFSAGAVRVLLPASTFNYYADLATDAAFTNPVRVAQRFRVGVVIAPLTRSYECGIARQYADTTVFPPIFTNTTTLVAANNASALGPDGGGNNAFFMQGVDSSTRVNGDPEGWTSGAEEMGRLMQAQLGVAVSICGYAAAGGGTDGQINHDGSLCAGFIGTVDALIGRKFRYFYGATEGWDGVNSSFPTPSYAEYQTRFVAAPDWIARECPACAVQAWSVANTGCGGNQGSANVGAGQAWQRIQAIIRNQIEPINPMVISKESSLWNEYTSGHATQGARVDYVRTAFRALMAKELTAFGGFQTTQPWPVLATTGTFNASARTFTIPFTIAAGANLVMLGANYNNPNVSYDTASSAEIANTISAFLPGQNIGNGKAIQLATATIDNSAKTITVALAGSSGILYADGSTDAAMPSGLSVNVGADFGTANGTFRAGRGFVLADDRAGNGVPYGWQVRPAIDIAVS